MRRAAFGIIAAVLLATAAVLLYEFGASEGRETMIASICLRAGLVLGAVWLAYSQVLSVAKKLSPTVAGIVIVGMLLLVFVRNRYVLFVIGPVLIALIVLHLSGHLLRPAPRRKRKRQGHKVQR